MKNLIQKVALPQTDVFYEKSSADGYALLGCAFAKSGLNYSPFIKDIESRNYTLNAAQKINATKTQCTKDNIYIYTNWACATFLNEIGADTSLFYRNAKDMGCYLNGFHKYCLEEINYVVPNGTTAALFIYNLHKDTNSCKNLLQTLKSNQIQGNWKYDIPTEQFPKGMKFEDNMHLGLILYQLWQVREHYFDEEMINKALRLYVDPKRWIPKDRSDNPYFYGTIGWGVPVSFLIFHVYGGRIEEIMGKEKYETRYNYFKNETITMLAHKNFRVRAYCAFALSHI